MGNKISSNTEASISKPAYCDISIRAEYSQAGLQTTDEQIMR